MSCFFFSFPFFGFTIACVPHRVCHRAFVCRYAKRFVEFSNLPSFVVPMQQSNELEAYLAQRHRNCLPR